jgi:hypothetical protein
LSPQKEAFLYKQQQEGEEEAISESPIEQRKNISRLMAHAIIDHGYSNIPVEYKIEGLFDF